MTATKNEQIADAIRLVIAKVQKELTSGRRSQMIDADDVAEIFLAIADEIEKS